MLSADGESSSELSVRTSSPIASESAELMVSVSTVSANMLAIRSVFTSSCGASTVGRDCGRRLVKIKPVTRIVLPAPPFVAGELLLDAAVFAAGGVGSLTRTLDGAR